MLDPERGGVHLISMWVAPRARGTGVSDRPVRAVLDWAVEGGHDVVRLEFAEHSAFAERLYPRNGFARTGGSGPIVEDWFALPSAGYPGRDGIRDVRPAPRRRAQETAMNDRQPADKGTDDVPGTGGAPNGSGRPSHGAADALSGAAGASRKAEPLARPAADTSGEDHGDVAGARTETRRPARVPEDAAVQASGAFGAAPEPETVTSAQVSEDAAAEFSGAGDESETATSAQGPESAAAAAGGVAGKPQTVSSRQDPEEPAGGAGGKPETVTSAEAPEGAGDLAGTAGTTEAGSTARHSAGDADREETPIAESVRRAAERAEQVEADAAAAAERGAAGIPGPVARPGRTLLETLRDKPILAAIPASTLAFILWRALRRR